MEVKHYKQETKTITFLALAELKIYSRVLTVSMDNDDTTKRGNFKPQ